MAIGRTFEEALGKAMRSLENGRAGLGDDGHAISIDSYGSLEDLVRRPTADRIFSPRRCVVGGASIASPRSRASIRSSLRASPTWWRFRALFAA